MNSRTTAQLSARLMTKYNTSYPAVNVRPMSPRKEAADIASPAMAKPFWVPVMRDPAA
ncbi:hypothetical protein D3C83_251310 [compost metagenome]